MNMNIGKYANNLVTLHVRGDGPLTHVNLSRELNYPHKKRCLLYLQSFTGDIHPQYQKGAIDIRIPGIGVQNVYQVGDTDDMATISLTQTIQTSKNIDSVALFSLHQNKNLPSAEGDGTGNVESFADSTFAYSENTDGNGRLAFSFNNDGNVLDQGVLCNTPFGNTFTVELHAPGKDRESLYELISGTTYHKIGRWHCVFKMLLIDNEDMLEV